MTTKKQSAQIKYLAFVASSIDGRIAKDGGSGTDWTSKEDWSFFQKSLESMDAVIVGHNTYKVAEARFKKRNTIVLTSKARVSKVSGSVVFFNPEKEDLKKFLRSKGYKKVAILGGPRVYNFFLKHGMLN